MVDRRPDLAAALRKIADVRRASDARAIAAEALERHAAWTKRRDRLKRLEALPSNKPLVSQRKGDEPLPAVEKRLYREAMGQ